ncbi:hypothetical protein Ddye_028977 [Dipteronia dyeriana]|uniref:Uncharacterized protein n=1 Tax=Dipteronia dyeriana TaxID=168575 RepID=A0AAD9WL82_9ROSI|nr:hypothetical protein Ddye_028977 [Dipteronia dyeriana]
MKELRLLILYGDQWFGENYEGGDLEMVFVPYDLTYHSFDLDGDSDSHNGDSDSDLDGNGDSGCDLDGNGDSGCDLDGYGKSGCDLDGDGDSGCDLDGDGDNGSDLDGDSDCGCDLDVDSVGCVYDRGGSSLALQPWIIPGVENYSIQTINNDEPSTTNSRFYKGIAKVMKIVYPDALHGLCGFHMVMNNKNKFIKEDVIEIFKRASKCYKESEFMEEMNQLQRVHPKAYDYLMNIGKEKWSHVYSPVRRYAMLTLSIIECLNSCL